MSDHKHGSMDITAQEQAYAGFIRASTIVATVSIVILILLAIFAS
ncbi:MAG: aa3-type cytochrome c oxidase subunit IV [Paracoccaceae bacterium]